MGFTGSIPVVGSTHKTCDKTPGNLKEESDGEEEV